MHKTSNNNIKMRIGGKSLKFKPSSNSLNILGGENSKYIISENIINLKDYKECIVIGDIHGDISVFYNVLKMTGKFEIDDKKLKQFLKNNNLKNDNKSPIEQFEENINKCGRGTEWDKALSSCIKWKDNNRVVENSKGSVVIFDGDLFDAYRGEGTIYNKLGYGTCCNSVTQEEILNTIWNLKERERRNRIIWVLGNHDMFNLNEKEKNSKYIPENLMDKKWYDMYLNIKPVGCVLLKNGGKYIYVCHGGISQTWIDKMQEITHSENGKNNSNELIVTMTNMIYSSAIIEANGGKQDDFSKQLATTYTNFIESGDSKYLPTWCRPITKNSEINNPKIFGEDVTQIIAHTILNDGDDICTCNKNENLGDWTTLGSNICRTDFGMGRSLVNNNKYKTFGIIHLKAGENGGDIEKKYTIDKRLLNGDYDFVNLSER